MTLNQAITLAKKLLSKYPELKGWSVSPNMRKRAFGVCDYRKKLIELSAILVPAMTDEAIQDTIVHEIAHALTPGHNHDYVWKQKCIELGGDGKRCHGSEKYTDGKVGQAIVMDKIAKYTLGASEKFMLLFPDYCEKKNIKYDLSLKKGKWYSFNDTITIIAEGSNDVIQEMMKQIHNIVNTII